MRDYGERWHCEQAAFLLRRSIYAEAQVSEGGFRPQSEEGRKRCLS